MSDNNSISDESYSDDDEEEELDPRIQDELEKLNAATNSINHLEAELDEARAVFRQTLAAATYQLNGIARKLGKCVDKSRPFYEAYRQLRQSHSMLQKSTNQFERATGMHIAAKTRVGEAETRVFGGNTKRAFDPALQEMLNQATIEVNEAEKMKRDSWKKHQNDLLAYRDLESKVKQSYKKLRQQVDKAKPYFEQKKDFDRHLWQLKLRVDSIHLGLAGAKENYSACLKSLEVISDEIHEKRKSKRMETMLAKLQEREAGVGADSSTEEETSLSASNLDLDFDSNINFDKLDEIGKNLCGNIESRLLSENPDVSRGSDRSVAGGNSKPNISSPVSLENRVVYGLESPKHGSTGAEENEQESKSNQTGSVSKIEDKKSLLINEEMSFTKETEEVVHFHDTMNTSQDEVQHIHALENDLERKESFTNEEETRNDDYSVIMAIDEMVPSTSCTLRGEDNGTVDDECLTPQVEENEQGALLVNELQGQDKETREKESHVSTQDEIADVLEKELNDAGECEKQTKDATGIETNIEQEKDVTTNNEDNDFTTESTNDQADGLGDDSELREKVVSEHYKEVTIDNEDAGGKNTAEQTGDKDETGSGPEIKEKGEQDDKEVTNDNNDADGKNTAEQTVEKDETGSGPEIKEKGEQDDKEVTNDKNDADGKNTAVQTVEKDETGSSPEI